MISLDAIDRRILERLQRDGRLSNADLAEQVGLVLLAVLAAGQGAWRKPA